MRFFNSSKVRAKVAMAAAVSVTAFSFVSGAAQAGFEWVPPASPSTPQTQQEEQPLMPVPATPGEQIPLEPVAAQPLVPPYAPNVPVAATIPPMAQPAATQGASTMQYLTVPPGAAAVPAPQEPSGLLKVKTITPPPGTQQPAPMQQPQAAARLQAQMDANIEAGKMPVPVQAQPLTQQQPAAAPIQPTATPTQTEPQAVPKIIWNPNPPVQKQPDVAPAPKVAAQAKPVENAKPSAADPKPGKKLVINPFPARKTVTPAIALKAETEETPDKAQAETFSKVVGFGSDMPLALALQQIAPSAYTFSFGDNVNPGVRVSWEGGGKPWNQVISDMIAPLSLKADVKGHIVHIANTSSAPRSEKHGAADQAEKPFTVASESLKRENIRDPGENPRAQPASTLVTIEAASGGASSDTTLLNQDQPASAAAPPATAPGQQPSDAPTPLLPAEEQDAPAATLQPEKHSEAMAPASATENKNVWQARQGDSLKETLDSWSKQAKVGLVWNATHDYMVDADITVNDSFKTAVDTVVARGVKAEKPLVTLEDGTLTIQDKT